MKIRMKTLVSSSFILFGVVFTFVNVNASPLTSAIKEGGKAAERVVDSVKDHTRIKNSKIESKVNAENARITQKGIANKMNMGVKIGKGANIEGSTIRTNVNLKNARIHQQGIANEMNMGVDIE